MMWLSLLLSMAAFADGSLPTLAPSGQEQALQPVSCTDPVAGVWKGSENGSRSQYHYTVTVSRTGQALSGTIEVHHWHGNSATPPPCVPASGGTEVFVTQPAIGTWDGHNFDFQATRIGHLNRTCGAPRGYTPDHIWGPMVTESVVSAISDDGKNGAESVRLVRVSCG